jgi:transposase
MTPARWPAQTQVPPSILPPHLGHGAPSRRAHADHTLAVACALPLGRPPGPAAVSAAATRWPGRSAPHLRRGGALAAGAARHALARLSYQEVHDWSCTWPALALACGLPLGTDGQARVPCKAQQSRPLRAAGALAGEMLFCAAGTGWPLDGVSQARDLIVDSTPILAWRGADPDAAFGHAPAHHPRPLVRGFRLHTLLCRGAGVPLLFLLSPANAHDAPFARPLLEYAVRLFQICPRRIRLDAGYRGLTLIAWIHTVLGTIAVIPWNPKRQKRRDGLPPTWTAEELGKRTSIERLFGRVFVFFRLQRPPVFGWSAVEMRVALTYAAVWVIALAAWQAGRPGLIRSPRLVLAHVWEGVEV